MTVVFPKAFASPALSLQQRDWGPTRPDPGKGRQGPGAPFPPALRETVRRLERHTPAAADHPLVPIGLPEIDAVLAGGGLAAGALHEILPGDPEGRPAAHDGAALGFAALALGRFMMHRGGRILWCRPAGFVFDAAPYPPALTPFLDPAQILLACTRRREETLWAIEEGLRCSSLAAVLGEIDTLDLVASRRLQLAAEKSGVPILLLRGLPRAVPRAGLPRAATTSAAVTRWRVASVPSVSTPDLRDIGAARWRIDLLRNRAGDPARHEAHSWTVEWTDETHRLAVVAAAFDRPAGAPVLAARAQSSRLAG
jgi:protein ImuA